MNIPFLTVKAAFALRQQPWVPAAILIAASAFFTLAHLGTARNMVLWARRRYELGLMGYGFPWEVMAEPMSAVVTLKYPSPRASV